MRGWLTAVRFLTGRLSGLKFNTLANLLAAILGVIVVVIAVRNHLISSAQSNVPFDLNASSIIVGTSMASIPDYDFRGAGRTLVLFLDAANEDSNEVAPLFKELTKTRERNPKLFQAIALFTNDRQTVERTLDSWDWPVEHLQAGCALHHPDLRPRSFGLDPQRRAPLRLRPEGVSHHVPLPEDQRAGRRLQSPLRGAKDQPGSFPVAKHWARPPLRPQAGGHDHLPGHLEDKRAR